MVKSHLPTMIMVKSHLPTMIMVKSLLPTMIMVRSLLFTMIQDKFSIAHHDTWLSLLKLLLIQGKVYIAYYDAR